MTIFDHFQHFFFLNFEFSYSEFFSGRFDTSGSMVPRLVPEILSLDAFCDGAAAGAGAGIGDSRSWMYICNMDSGYIHHHSAWWWWWFLDMRSGCFGEESLAASGFASNRALRQTSDSLLQTSKPGRSLFVLGVFFFVLSFTLLLRLLTRCIWFCLFVS